MHEPSPTRPDHIRLSVIVPARNEEDVLESCLHSLLRQSTEGFEVRRDWELIVVNDHSTDRTRDIALSLAGVTVLDAGPLPPGWTGKANALWSAAQQSRGEWLVFTDADTIHEPGSLQRAETEGANFAMLSYSPRQLISGFTQRILMPVIFSQLALTYPPAKVSDPDSRFAAANGQFLMIRRGPYFEIGGHTAVADSLLEDVDLATLLKSRKYPIRFRYAPDALSARMYRTTRQMIEGWTKNLARLFPHPVALAVRRAIEVFAIVALPVLAVAAWMSPGGWSWLASVSIALWILLLSRQYVRAAKSNFPRIACALSIFGLPLFSLLLVRSWFRQSIKRQVVWKGREYSTLKK